MSEDTMSGTLRDQLARELRRKVVFITPQEQEVFLAYEKLADAAIAFIAAWALEPAQAEKAAIAIATTDSADRDHERGAERWAGWDGELKEPYFDFARAAIAALFGEPK